MLLELWDSARSLSAAGVAAGETDTHLKPYPKKAVFFVDLDERSRVTAIRAAVPEDIARLRKYETSAGGLRESTPGFNIDPLFGPCQLDDEKGYRKDIGAFKKQLERGGIADASQRGEKIDAFLDRSEPAWNDRAKAVQKCLQDAARVLTERLGQRAQEDEPEWLSLRDILSRSMVLDADQFRHQLGERALAQLREASPVCPLDRLVSLLFLDPSVVILELADAVRFSCRANSERVWGWVNRLLLNGGSKGIQSQESAMPSDAILGIFGESFADDDKKMPQVKLPRLGTVILRSLSGSIPCQQRYGLIEAASCPVGESQRGKMAAALDWLVQPERECKTWADVSEACGFDLPAILLAYPGSIPADPPMLAELIAGPKNIAAIRATEKFATYAESVIERLQGVMKAAPKEMIRVFVLAKADKARTKLLSSQQFTVGRIIDAARQWQEAGRNIPWIPVRQFTEVKGQTRWEEPLVPFPGQVVWCLNTAWQRSGTHPDRVSAIDFGSGMTLLLGEGTLLEQIARQAMRLALAHWIPLLLALGEAHHRGRVHPMGGRYGKQSLLLPSILGLLLAKLNIWKGAYMASNHYLIGQLFTLADRVHLNYCNRMREGKVPNGPLLGNSLMATALENPAIGLARLAERFPLYYQVAPTPLREELAVVEQQIDKEHLPTSSCDSDKALMLLGYLARSDKQEIVPDSNSNPQGDDA